MQQAGGPGGPRPPQILADQKAPPGSGGAPHYYRPPRIFDPWCIPVLFQLCHILMDCGISNNMKKKRILKNYNWIPISNKNSGKNSSYITDERAWKDSKFHQEFQANRNRWGSPKRCYSCNINHSLEHDMINNLVSTYIACPIFSRHCDI